MNKNNHGGKRAGAGRKPLPDEQKAKRYTFRLYLWEVEKVREFIKSLRNRKEQKMNKYTILNTKTNETIEYFENEIAKNFECDVFYDNNIFKYEYDSYLKGLDDEEEKQDFINYWSNRNIFDDETEYFTDMIEFETWTSPSGIRPVYKVVSVEDVDIY